VLTEPAHEYHTQHCRHPARPAHEELSGQLRSRYTCGNCLNQGKKGVMT